MIPTSFTYKRAGSVQEALSLLNEDAKILAGGHSLIPAMKLRLDQPETLIDISRIASLRSISEQGDHLVIGACVTHGEIIKSELIQNHCGLLAACADMIGDVQVRNKGTLGGSLAHSDPAADWPAVMIATGATIKVESNGGSRTIAASDFFTGFYETALQEGELITEIHVPKLDANDRFSYQKFMQPASRFAIVGCAAILRIGGDNKISSARVALTGVTHHAFMDSPVVAALENQDANAGVMDHASSAAAEVPDMLSDHYASETYRKHLAKVYTKRALLACIQ